VAVPATGRSGEILDEARALLAAAREAEAEAAFERALAAAAEGERARVAHQAGSLAHKAGRPQLAVRWFRRAGELAPRDAEMPHDRGLAHLEVGDVGLAAQAQGEALRLDPDHVGARAQRAAALEALGDDDGAAHELAELLSRIGPQPALSARLEGLRRAAARAAHLRLLGGPRAALERSPLLGTVFAREPAARGSAAQGPTTLWLAGFGELSAEADPAGRIARLQLVFADMEASLARSDLAYGGSTEDQDGRRVPLDEFTSAATVFFAQACGIEALRARRLLRFLLAPEAGLAPLPFAGLRVGWAFEGEGPTRRYGLYAMLPPGAMN
jgi:tetratricopeptide (TPR) repeat protein